MVELDWLKGNATALIMAMHVRDKGNLVVDHFFWSLITLSFAQSGMESPISDSGSNSS